MNFVKYLMLVNDIKLNKEIININKKSYILYQTLKKIKLKDK